MPSPYTRYESGDTLASVGTNNETHGAMHNAVAEGLELVEAMNYLYLVANYK
jgi:hypothetical protein